MDKTTDNRCLLYGLTYCGVCAQSIKNSLMKGLLPYVECCEKKHQGNYLYVYDTKDGIWQYLHIFKGLYKFTNTDRIHFLKHIKSNNL